MNHPRVRAALVTQLAEHQAQATGSAARVMRMLLMKEPPRFEKGEITDKGSLNQRAVLHHRSELVDALYADGADVIRAGECVAA